MEEYIKKLLEQIRFQKAHKAIEDDVIDEPVEEKKPEEKEEKKEDKKEEEKPDVIELDSNDNHDNSNPQA